MNLPPPKSLVATFHLPDVKVRVYLNFDFKKGEKGNDGPGEDLKSIDSILGQVNNMPAELQEIILKFASFLKGEGQEREG